MNTLRSFYLFVLLLRTVVAQECLLSPWPQLQTKAKGQVNSQLVNTLPTAVLSTSPTSLSSPIVGPGLNGLLYAAASDESIRAINPLTSTAVWTLPIEGSAYGTTPALSHHNILYFGTTNGFVYAINVVPTSKDLSSISTVWEIQLSESAILTSVLLSNTKDVVYVSSSDNFLYAIDGIHGGVIWKFKTGGPIASSPTITQDDKTIFVGSDDSMLYAINAASGEKLWEFHTSNEVKSSPLLSHDDHRVYISSSDGHVYTIDTEDGKVLWDVSLEDSTVESLVLSHDFHAVYTTTVRGDVIALSETDGTHLWSFPTGSTIMAQIMVDSQGNLIIATTEGLLHIVDKFGKLKFESRHFGSRFTASPARDACGIVHFPSDDGLLRSINVNERAAFVGLHQAQIMQMRGKDEEANAIYTNLAKINELIHPTIPVKPK